MTETMRVEDPPLSYDEEKSQLVQMRLQPRTVKRIKSLSRLTGNANRTSLVSASIQLTEDLVSRMKDGDRVVIEARDGTKEVLKFVGM